MTKSFQKYFDFLYNTITVKSSQDSSKSFAELAFLFDTRLPRPKKVPKHYNQRMPSKSPAALAQCFASMPIMKHDFDQGWSKFMAIPLTLPGI